MIVSCLTEATVHSDVITIVASAYFGSDAGSGFQLALTRLEKTIHCHPNCADPENVPSSLSTFPQPFVVPPGSIPPGEAFSFGPAAEFVSLNATGSNVWKGIKPTETTTPRFVGADWLATQRWVYRRCALVLWLTDRTVQLHGSTPNGLPSALAFVADQICAEIHGIRKRSPIPPRCMELIRQLFSLGGANPITARRAFHLRTIELECTAKARMLVCRLQIDHCVSALSDLSSARIQFHDSTNLSRRNSVVPPHRLRGGYTRVRSAIKRHYLVLTKTWS